jgi:hypothetical protein
VNEGRLLVTGSSDLIGTELVTNCVSRDVAVRIPDMGFIADRSTPDGAGVTWP